MGYGHSSTCGHEAIVSRIDRRRRVKTTGIKTNMNQLSRLVTAAMLFVIGGAAITAVQAQKAPHTQKLNQEFHKVAKDVSPAVVHITTVREVRRSRRPFGGGSGRQHPFFGDEFFERFFDTPRRRDSPEKYRKKGMGSGVIVDAENGYVLTNYHVVRKTKKVKVKLGEHRDYEADIVGTDSATDLAVLQIDADDLPEAKLAGGDNIKVGHHVLAIGNPFGLDRTITSGIISATGRENIGIAEYESFIQTDAAINPGNSGGPLVNMEGEIIGISTAIFSRSGGHMGIGFAVPADMVKSVMNELIEHGKVTRGWLGVRIQEFTPEIAKALQADVEEGVLIADVISDTPAEEAGLKRGDLIIKFNGEDVSGVSALRRKVADVDPETEVPITVVRDGGEKRLKVEIAKRPKKEGQAESEESEWELGIEVENLTDELRQRYGIQLEKGVLITSVGRGSPAANAGVRPGMVILEVNRKRVHNVEDFKNTLDQIPPSQKLLLLVSHRGSTSYVLVEPLEE